MFCPQDEPFTCIGAYTIQQHDMDAGMYNSTSNVSAVSPNGTTISDSIHHSANLVGAAGVTIGEGGHSPHVISLPLGQMVTIDIFTSTFSLILFILE